MKTKINIYLDVFLRFYMAIKNISIRIDEQMLHKLHVVADYEGRSANSQVLILIRDAIEKYEQIKRRISTLLFHRMEIFLFTNSAGKNRKNQYGCRYTGPVQTEIQTHKPQSQGSLPP